MLGLLVAIPSWLPSGGAQHSPGQNLSCRMVPPSCLSPSLTGFQTIKQTSKGILTVQHAWGARSTIPAKHFKHAWWMQPPTQHPCQTSKGPHYPPMKGNIAEDPEDDLDMPTTALGHMSDQHTVHDESFLSAAPIHADSGGAQAIPFTSVLRNILTASLVMLKQEFSIRSIDGLKALMFTEDRTQTLIKVGMEEATTHFNAHASQDEASYDGNTSEADQEDVEVIPDEVDDAWTEGSKLASADTLPDNEGQEATNKEDDG